MKKIGIFSGTFNPVHEGHVSFALTAAKDVDLAKVYFLVEPQPRRKQGVKAYEHRLAMVDLAIAKYPNLGQINLAQERFSIAHTLPLLLRRFKGSKLYFLLGEDVLGHLSHWPHVATLLKNVTLLIGCRENQIKQVRTSVNALQTARNLFFDYQLFTTAYSGHSSSGIRRDIKAGKSPTGLNPAVRRYISQQQLYASGDMA